MIDNKFTKKIQKWLNDKKENRSIIEGAELLLRMNRNKFLFQNIINRPEKMEDKLIYELKKHLNIRLDGNTIEDVNNMVKPIMTSAQEIISKNEKEENNELNNAHKGKREDHEKLPEKIKDLFESNIKRYAKLKMLYNELLEMQNKPACDRYELLKLLKDVDHNYRISYEQYDNYKLIEKKENKEEKEAGIIAKRIAASRKFICVNLKKLDSMEIDKKEAIVEKIKKAADYVKNNGGTFSEETQKTIEKL